ncbi:MAG: Gfo/Idh/MocA family oxidoreductase [Clostridiales bacterium]|jgi:predicted dehydrogenase|nr:Gfo/Idh/MocA family oxidoreductase [Clostridiales bacterium]
MEKKNTVRIGAVGLSGRGSGMLGLLLQVEGVTVPAVCDLVPERMENGIDIVESSPDCDYEVHGYLDYKEMLKNEQLDALFIATTWITHSRIACDAMKAGLHVAFEVGGAASVEECWELVRTSRESGKFCMLLENCCYDRNEMAIYNMAKLGMFGELIHLEGGYRHDLRDEITLGRENIHGRLYNFMNRNGELYPTHQLGPISKLLNINRGNRFLTVSSFSTKSRGLNEWIRQNKGVEYDLYGTDFACGDVVTTIIKCAHGETIQLTHDCCLPRPYSRDYLVQGTKGIYEETEEGDAGRIYLDGLAEKGHRWESFKPWRDKYEHPLWKTYEESGVKAGHGGMDFLVLSAFVESIQLGGKPPIDVYDAAAWMAVTCLSEQSIALGGAPVAVPDFTNGRWIDREEPIRRGIYCLDDICTEFFPEK